MIDLTCTSYRVRRALDKLHRTAARWEILVEVYLNRLETLEEVSRRSELLRTHRDGVRGSGSKDNNQAFDALVNAFSEDFADDATSSSYLEKMAQATGRWGELINTANAWLQEEEDPKQKIQLCLRLGKWYGEDLGHPGVRTQPYYAQVMHAARPEQREGRAADGEHLPNRRAVAEDGRNAYACRSSIAVANDDRRAILFDLGELLERQMNQSDQGMAYYKRALEVEALFLPALEALERIYAERGQPDAGSHPDPDEQGEGAHRLRADRPDEPPGWASCTSQKLRDLEKAGQVYRDVLQVDGSKPRALSAASSASAKRSSGGPILVDVLERQLDVVESERERIEVLIKLAGIQEEQFLKADVAAQRLEQVLEIDHAEKRAYVALERCYRRLKQWLDLIGAYERHISDAAEPVRKGRRSFFRAIAQIRLRGRGR